MENWLMMVMSVCIGAVVVVVVRFLVSISISSHKNNNNNKNLLLPPGPPSFPIITSISWLRKSTTEIESILRNLHRKYGPLVTLWITHRPAIFVADRSIAHQALVQNGAVFADRPPALLTSRILSHNQHNISSASYGPTWRLLRRNLTSEILHPSRLKSYSNARSWVLHLLLDRLSISINNSPTPATDNCVIITKVKEHLQYAMFCLLVLMCFGDKLDEPKIKDIETVQRRLLLRLRRFNILNFWPNITKILLRSRWKEFLQLRQDQESVLIPLIEARRKIRSSLAQDEDELIVCYVDTLLDLRLQEKDEKERELEMGEIVSLCSEFLNAGTDTTSTALEWIMANMVKHPHIQDKLYEEMKEIMMHQDKARASAKQLDDANDHVMIEEEDLQKMPYLKAVILEGLRRHPPGHFVLPHAVTEEEVVLGGHVVPKNATINFMVAEMGWDPNVWVDPMAFKPERFLSPSQVDITGSKEIKMMPFGAGRRICPGYGLAILHLEYFVANLVWRFQWKPVDGDEVDLSEKQEFTTVMKYPLKARLFPRSHSS